jgi:stage V sporulation protein R
MAHVYGHNDFFKNNRLFRDGTDADYTLEMFKNDGTMIKNYINDPSIGYEQVEKMINSAHSIKLQVSRNIGIKRKDDEETKRELMDSYKEKKSRQSTLEPKVHVEPPDINKIPLNPEDDLLFFIIKYGELEEWQKNTLEVVRRESEYFIPQIETKIMNEGWASYWHYNILKKLELPPPLNLEFIKRHNDVVRPIPGGLNPYYLGFEIFSDLAERCGIQKIFEAREFDRDASFVRRYLTQELCRKLNLFEYIRKGTDYFIEEVSDETGWEEIRNMIADSAGMGSVPYIRVTDMSRKDKTLSLEHVFDGRELNQQYAEETLKCVYRLWGHKVVLKTKHSSREVTFSCEDGKKTSFNY